MFIFHIIGIVFLLLTFSSLTSCTTGVKSDDSPLIDFGYFNNSPEAFNLRVTDDDTVFLLQIFSNDSTSIFQDSVLYYGLLQSESKTTIDSIISVIRYLKLKAIYESDDLDGEVYSFSVRKDTGYQLIQVRHPNPPVQLERLKAYLLQVKKETQFRPAGHFLSFNVPVLEVPPLDMTGSR